jgi:hypothetical protein
MAMSHALVEHLENFFNSSVIKTLNGNEESILDDKVDKGLQNVRIFYG